LPAHHLKTLRKQGKQQQTNAANYKKYRRNRLQTKTYLVWPDNQPQQNCHFSAIFQQHRGNISAVTLAATPNNYSSKIYCPTLNLKILERLLIYKATSGKDRMRGYTNFMNG
jgi:Tfp pilus assembly protein PilE